MVGVSQGPCVNRLGSQPMKFIMVGPIGRSSGHWGHALEGDSGTLVPSLCFLDTTSKQLCSTTGDHREFEFLYHRLKGISVRWPWIETSGSVPTKVLLFRN